MATPVAPTRGTQAAGLPRLLRTEPTDLFHLALCLAADESSWRPHVRFAADNRWSVRIAATDRYEAWLLTWLPAQSTGLHDHGGVPGAFAVLRGSVHESTLAAARRGLPTALVHRTIPAGQARAFGPHLVHDVANTGHRPAISLHVYAPALDSMRRFVIDDRGHLRVVAVEESGRDW